MTHSLAADLYNTVKIFGMLGIKFVYWNVVWVTVLSYDIPIYCFGASKNNALNLTGPGSFEYIDSTISTHFYSKTRIRFCWMNIDDRSQMN